MEELRVQKLYSILGNQGTLPSDPLSQFVDYDRLTRYNHWVMQQLMSNIVGKLRSLETYGKLWYKAHDREGLWNRVVDGEVGKTPLASKLLDSL